MSKSPNSKSIDAGQLTLDEWLDLLRNPPENSQFVDFQFPTDRHRDEYIAGIDQRSEEEVLFLLEHFLLPSGTLGIDHLRMSDVKLARQTDPQRFKAMMEIQYYKRLLLISDGAEDIQPWEGITWVMDLLPHRPKDALDGLNAYVSAHIMFLPDGRIFGLTDSEELIRAKYIGLPGSQSEIVALLMSLSSRDFECLVERLYASMGFETELTPPSKDGGSDIIATNQEPARRESLRIECKRYSGPVGVSIARALLGVVSSEKSTKGVLVTTSRFTSQACKFAADNPRLELIDGDQLARLMNEYLGPKWTIQIERLIRESQSEAGVAPGKSL